MSANIWQLQEAKNKFSELVVSAKNNGPQFVTKHGRKSVVIIDIDEYNKMTKPKRSLFDVLRNAPEGVEELSINRSKELARDFEL